MDNKTNFEDFAENKFEEPKVESNRKPEINKPTLEKKIRVKSEAVKGAESINSALKNSTDEANRLLKDQKAIEDSKRAEDFFKKSIENGELNIFDSENNKPNVLGRPYAGINKNDQQKILHSENNPTSNYARKSIKFRNILSTFFGKVAVVAAIGVVAAFVMGNKIGNEAHENFSGKKNVSVITSSQIVNENGIKKTVNKTLNLEKIAEDDFFVKSTRKFTTKDFNNLFSYMDHIAATASASATQNYHMIKFGMDKGGINQQLGLELLAESKKNHTSFLNDIQKNKDEIVVFSKKILAGDEITYQQVKKGEYKSSDVLYRKGMHGKFPYYKEIDKGEEKNHSELYKKLVNPADVFYKNHDGKSLADQALGRESSSTGITQTPYEKFLFWSNKSRGEINYTTSENKILQAKIYAALGSLGPQAKTNSYVQMATGAKTDYNNINTQINQQEKIQNTPKYDALASKASQMMDDFSKKAQENSQIANNRTKP